MIKMALERTYIIPLRSEWSKVPKYKRAKKAVKAIKEFMQRHMKSDNVKVGEILNKLIWQNGIKNPPHKVKVTAIKEEDGMVKVELFGQKYVAKVKVEKVEKKSGIAGKLQDALAKPKAAEDKEEEKTEGKADENKEVKKSEEKIKKELDKLEKKTDKIKEKKEDKPKEEKKPEPKKESKPAEKKPAKPAKEPEAKPKK